MTTDNKTNEPSRKAMELIEDIMNTGIDVFMLRENANKIRAHIVDKHYPPAPVAPTAPATSGTPRTDAHLELTRMAPGKGLWATADFARTLESELAAANAEIARCKSPEVLHAHCIRYLSDAQVSHLFGERMTEIANNRITLQARVTELEAASEQRMEYDRVSVSVADQLRAELAELREDKERLDALEKMVRWDDGKNLIRISFQVPTLMHCTLRSVADAARSSEQKQEGTP